MNSRKDAPSTSGAQATRANQTKQSTAKIVYLDVRGSDRTVRRALKAVCSLIGAAFAFTGCSVNPATFTLSCGAMLAMGCSADNVAKQGMAYRGPVSGEVVFNDEGDVTGIRGSTQGGTSSVLHATRKTWHPDGTPRSDFLFSSDPTLVQNAYFNGAAMLQEQRFTQVERVLDRLDRRIDSVLPMVQAYYPPRPPSPPNTGETPVPPEPTTQPSNAERKLDAFLNRWGPVLDRLEKALTPPSGN